MRRPDFIVAAAAMLLIVGVLGRASAQSVSIARWRNNATGAYSLALDDYAAPYFGDRLIIDSVTYNRGLTISFSTIAKYLTGAQSAFGRHMMERGHTLTNHSWNHSCNPIVTPDTIAMEFDSAKARIEREMQAAVPGFKCLYWQAPCGEQSEANTTYLRAHEYIGGRSFTFSGLNSYDVPDPFNIGEPCYQPNAGLGVLNGHVSSAISSGDWAVRQAHCVSDNAGLGYAPITVAIFRDHMNYCAQQVAAGQLWMAPVTDVLKYAMERKSFTVQVLSHDQTAMTVGFTTDAVEINPSPMVDNTYYDYPLTLLVTLPGGFTNVGVTQGAQQIDYVTDGGRIRFDADPWGGTVTITNDAGVAVGRGRPQSPAPSLRVWTPDRSAAAFYTFDGRRWEGVAAAVLRARAGSVCVLSVGTPQGLRCLPLVTR